MQHDGKLYQDPLYGAKVLSPLAVRIIDTPEFQRLAGLRQLGFSDVVYRGAHHTRFEHSVGTYFISRTIMRRIVQNHERLELEHPGKVLSSNFRQFPSNAEVDEEVKTLQSRWRGLTEVVSIAALLHDIGHVPFGHTLEDEFAGIFPRHDRLAGPRLHAMLFDPSSELAAVINEPQEPWIGKIPNKRLGQLIYVILNWKERIDAREGFDALLKKEIEQIKKQPTSEAESNEQERRSQLQRLEDLQKWHTQLLKDKLFHPFMSDIIGNTICSDLLDYLPRDRTYLGMEARYHGRLQRYFTICKGTLYPQEGWRMSIMVTRGAHGGQRRDVATAVLNIMRERYEMAEQVYYHHKKAAASAMLAKLVELTPKERRPRDDDKIYPAPWGLSGYTLAEPPHMTHLSDFGLIEYLGHVEVADGKEDLQKRLHSAIVSRRRDMFRTLLVVDCELANSGPRRLEFIADELRGPNCKPDSTRRWQLEKKLAEAANGRDGDVIIYCPSASMQSKEVDARMEIEVGRILPLRVQEQNFTYHAEVELLKKYYSSLWRAYIFVAPEIFENPDKCRPIVDMFCDHYELPRTEGYKKVRTHRFQESVSEKALTEAGLIDIFDGAVKVLEDRALAIAEDQAQSVIEEALTLVVTPIAKKPPQSSIDIEKLIVHALGPGFRRGKGREAVKKWVEQKSDSLSTKEVGSLIVRIRNVSQHTPGGLLAARGKHRLLVEGGLSEVLDSCLAEVRRTGDN